MDLGRVLGALLQGGGNALSAYGQYTTAKRRADKDDAFQQAHIDLANQQLQQHEQDRLGSDADQLAQGTAKELEAAGIYGSYPALSALAKQNGNRTQSGAGTSGAIQGYAASALDALKSAKAAPDYDPTRGADLGNGLTYQGPSYEKVQPDHFSPVYGKDNNIGAFDTRTGSIRDTGFEGRAMFSGGPNDMRGLQVVDDPVTGLHIVNKRTGQSRPVTDESGNPAQGPSNQPNQAEQQGAMLINSAKGSIGRVSDYYDQHGAPSVVEQGLVSASKGQGVVGSLARKALASVDPELQAVIPDLTTVYRAYVYITTGKQLNEAEAADNATQYVPMGGDDESTVKRKIAKIHEMANAVTASTQRGQNFIDRVNSGGSSTSRASALKQKYNLE